MPSRLSELASPSATAEVLERFGLSPKKQFGQNFLINDAIVRKILSLADVGAEDDVVEIGPGIGTLTCALVSAARSVVSIERDPDLADVLDHTLKGTDNLQLVMCDALDVSEDTIAHAVEQLNDRGMACSMPTKLVANLPYSVAATVVLRFFQELGSMRSSTVMVQREVAQRMQARLATKDYGAYTVKLSMFAKPSGSFPVSAGNFLPPPRVESTVIRLDRVIPLDQSGAEVSSGVVRLACMMADAAFFSRRKTIANSCASYFKSRGETALSDIVPDILRASGIDARRRGETLDQQEFLTLGEALREACPGIDV